MPSNKTKARKLNGFIYCYDELYRLLFYWGVITFRLEERPKSTPLRVIYALTMRFALIFGFIWGVYIKVSDARMSLAMFSHMSPLIKIIFSWESISCILTYIHYCVTLDGHRSRHIRLLMSMQSLDTQVTGHFPHVSWRYSRTRSKYWYGTIGITICYNLVSLALMLDTTRCSCGLVSTILIACTYSWMTSSLGAMGFIHIGLMDYLRLRYRLIMKLLHQLYGGTVAAGQDHQRILKLFEVGKGCGKLLSEMNAVCGSVAATGIFYDFSHMTCFVYMLCQKVLRSEPFDTQYTFLALHLIIHVYKVIITCTYGYLLQREKRDCLRLLSEYAVLFGRERRIREFVAGFQHWRMHNNHMATIGSSFHCNVSMIYVVFNGLANYVIVLVQLLFQLQLKDRPTMSLPLPKDVELVKPITQIFKTHDN